MKLTLRELSQITHVAIRNQNLLEGRKLTGVSTDSRQITAGDLFVALRGPRFDGHNFLHGVFENGAMAAIVELSADLAAYSHAPLIVVEDSTRALGELARIHRMRFRIPVIAVAGSNGKTTTKDMITQVLSTRFNVLNTEGNLNNQIGVPQTLVRLTRKHDVAVVEIGTNHPGEIRYLCSILQPTHGLVTSIGREHLEFFKTIDGVADEEGELFEDLQRNKKSVAFMSADDPHIVKKARGVKHKISYGILARKADVRGKILSMRKTGAARFSFKGRKMRKPMDVQLCIPGEHNARNALAAAAVGLTFQVTPKQICRALESCAPADRRMQVENLSGVVVYNDTYNANPDSTLAALQTLAAAHVTGKRIAVLADMLELGEGASEEHVRIGAEVGRLGIEYLLTFGQLAKNIHHTAKGSFIVHYDQKNILAEYLAELVGPGDAVLVKGSRGMNMEDVVTFLKERMHPAASPPVREKTVQQS